MQNSTFGIEYTGHPFVDVGLATMAYFKNKGHPRELTASDLDAIASYVEREYIRSPLRSYLTMAFTSNGWFIQDAYNPDKDTLTAEERETRRARRAELADYHLRQWQPSSLTSNELCVFTGLPAIVPKLSNKLPASRAARAQIPLLQGDEAINFFPDGNPGLPVSAIALLALQVFPLGCAKSGLGLLAVHSDNPNLTYAFASDFLDKNNTAIAQARMAREDGLPGYALKLKTLLIDVLTRALREQREANRDGQPATLTAYNFNNGKSPDLHIYQLPSEVVSFVQAANTVTYHEAWNELVRRGWQLGRGQRKARGENADDVFAPARNYLYEDLFDLPDGASRFIRTYFLRVPRRTTFEEDPRRGYSLESEVSLVSWSLVELFLRKVIHVEDARIQQIRVLGDRLAEYVRTEGGSGKRFFRAFFQERSFANFRSILIRANVRHIEAGHPPLFDLNSYIEVFEDGFEVRSPQWWLARDLVFIRMVDQLKEWLVKNPDAAPMSELEEDQVPAVTP